MKSTAAVELVSVKYLARTFHRLPDDLVEQLSTMGVEPVEVRDGIRFYTGDVVERLREDTKERDK